MIARAVATESGTNFMAVKGAELLNTYVGETERAIREIFAKARAVSPTVLFFDEIDAIAASRSAGSQHTGVHTVTTLLTEMDGLEQAKGVFTLAATNRPEVLDPALLRPGRLDSMVYVGLPDEAARRTILEKACRKWEVGESVDFSAIAGLTNGRSGAEMVSICQRALHSAFQDVIECDQEPSIQQRHFAKALDEEPYSVTAEMEESYKEFAASRINRRSEINFLAM